MRFSFINLPIEYYSPYTGGAIATIIFEVATELEKLGHHVSVLSANDTEDWLSAGQVIPLNYHTKDKMNWIRGKWSGLLKRLNRWDWPGYDTYLNAVQNAIRKNCHERDCIVFFNDFVTQRYARAILPNAIIFSWLQNEWRSSPTNIATADKATTKFLTCSRYIAGWTATNHQLQDHRFAVLESGVNLQQFFPSTCLDTSSGALKVLCVGRLDPNKGPDIAVNAVRKLQLEGLDIQFTLAGATWFYGGHDDHYSTRLKGSVKDIGGRCLGHVGRDQIATVYHAADVVCVLSRSQEPFGLVALEAMASGCAVIASNRGGLPEACGAGATLVNPDDHTSIENQLRIWATDRNALAKAKHAALARAHQASWAVTARKLIEIADEVKQH